MKVVYCLAGVIAAVEDGAKPGARDTQLRGNLLSGHEKIREHRGVLVLHVQYIDDVLLGHDQHVNLRLWIDVSKRKDSVVFENLLARQGALNNLAENTFFGFHKDLVLTRDRNANSAN